jgi:hypothetical protein
MRLILLKGVYPNPFSEDCKIYFLLRNPADVTMTVYNVAGEIIVKQVASLAAGVNIQVWEGKNEAGGRCASGVYLVKVKAQNVQGEHDEFWATVAIAR